MPEVTNLILGICIAYLWIAYEMVSFHHKSPAIHRPGYVYGRNYQKVLIGFAWPYVSWRNDEFGWFISMFISYAVILMLCYSFATEYLSPSNTTLIIGITRITPNLAVLFNAPIALLGTIVWLLIAKPLGSKIPTALIKKRN